MTTQNDREARLFANRLIDLRNSSPFGANATQVRASTIWLRDAHDNFERLWEHVGLAGCPTVPAYRLNVPVTPGLSAFIYQALEPVATIKQDEDYLASMGAPPELIAQNIVSQLPVGGGEYFVASDIGLSEDTEPYVLEPIPVRDFFTTPFIVIAGFAISRFDVLNYAAYEKGYIHTNGSRNRARYPEQIARLDWFERSYTGLRRPNTEYLIMDCSRALATAPDADRFVKAVLG